MTNKEMINKLKDNAELAMASYGYFHLIGKKFDDNEKYKNRKNTIININDILDITYKGYVTSNHTTLINPEKLKGDFAPLQAQRLFERYDLLIHQPNTESGFSATLFKEKTTKQYTLAIRGTELSLNQAWQDVIAADGSLLYGSTPKDQYEDMILFYYQCIGKIPFYVDIDSKPKVKDNSILCDAIGICNHNIEYELWQKLYQRSKDSKYKPYINPSLLKDSTKPPFIESSFQYNIKSNFTPPIDSKTKLTITGHSLGGALAQLLILSLCDDKNRNNIKALYTYNAPGARRIIPPYDYIVKLFTFHSKEQQEKFIKKEIGKISNRAKDLDKNNNSLENKIQQTLQHILEKQESQYYGITFNISNTTTTMVLTITATPILADMAQCYEILAYNYAQHFKEDKNTFQNLELKGDKRYIYKLSIQDSIYHCESSNNEYKNEWYMGSLISKLGIKLGLHQDNQYSDTTILHTITTGKGITGSHSIIPLTQTLYLYSYLVELDSNNAMLESKIQSNNDKKRLSEYLYTINVFMSDIKTAMNILINEIDKKNKEKYKKFRKQTKWYQSTQNYEDIDYLALFISQINGLAFKIETLKNDNNQYFTSNMDINEIIDTIYKLQEYNYFIEIIDNNKLEAMRNQCQANKKASIAEKLSLETCQPFRLVNKNNVGYLNENNFHQIFGYKNLGYILSQEWHEEYINGRYKMMKGLYFGGNTISSLSKYAKDKELQIS